MDDLPEVGAAILRPLQSGELAAVEDLIDDAAGFAARDADEGDAADARAVATAQIVSLIRGYSS